MAKSARKPGEAAGTTKGPIVVHTTGAATVTVTPDTDDKPATTKTETGTGTKATTAPKVKKAPAPKAKTPEQLLLAELNKKVSNIGAFNAAVRGADASLITAILGKKSVNAATKTLIKLAQNAGAPATPAPLTPKVQTALTILQDAKTSDDDFNATVGTLGKNDIVVLLASDTVDATIKTKILEARMALTATDAAKAEAAKHTVPALSKGATALLNTLITHGAGGTTPDPDAFQTAIKAANVLTVEELISSPTVDNDIKPEILKAFAIQAVEAAVAAEAAKHTPAALDPAAASLLSTLQGHFLCSYADAFEQAIKAANPRTVEGLILSSAVDDGMKLNIQNALTSQAVEAAVAAEAAKHTPPALGSVANALLNTLQTHDVGGATPNPVAFQQAIAGANLVVLDELVCSPAVDGRLKVKIQDALVNKATTEAEARATAAANTAEAGHNGKISALKKSRAVMANLSAIAATLVIGPLSFFTGQTMNVNAEVAAKVAPIQAQAAADKLAEQQRADAEIEAAQDRLDKELVAAARGEAPVISALQGFTIVNRRTIAGPLSDFAGKSSGQVRGMIIDFSDIAGKSSIGNYVRLTGGFIPDGRTISFDERLKSFPNGTQRMDQAISDIFATQVYQDTTDFPLVAWMLKLGVDATGAQSIEVFQDEHADGNVLVQIGEYTL